MNKNYKLLIGIGALAALYFVFKKKGTTAKSTSADKSGDSTIKSAKVEGGTMSIDEKELLDNVKRKSEIKAGDSPKVIAIKKFAVDVFSNQPKSPEEFLARASKAGLSQADLQSPEAQKIMNPFASFEDGVSSRAELRKEYGLSVADDKKLFLEMKKAKKSFEKDGISGKELLTRLFKHLKKFAKNNELNFDAFRKVQAEVTRQKMSTRVRKKKRYQNYAGELESRIGDSRIKPTSVSGLSVAKRASNYGTAQRPTRPLMGKKRGQPIETSEKMSNSLDFDGNDDVQSSIM